MSLELYAAIWNRDRSKAIKLINESAWTWSYNVEEGTSLSRFPSRDGMNARRLIGYRDNTLFHAVCEVGDDVIDLIKLMLEKQAADVNSLNSYGETALYLACYECCTEIVKLLLQKGAKNTVTESGMTPFMAAVQSGSKDTVELIWNSGIVYDLDARSENGQTALYYACRSGKKDIVEFLLNKGAKIGKDGVALFIAAAQSGVKDIVELIWNSGTVDNIDVQDNDGHTALYHACFRGTKDMVEFLLHKGAKIGKEEGVDLFILATQSGVKDIVELIWNSGSVDNIDAQDNYGRTALHHACRDGNGYQEVVSFLIKKGAKSIVYVGMTPFMVAVKNKALNIMELLWNSGMVDNIDAEDNEGYTALHYACCGDDGYQEVVSFLIGKGAKSIVNVYGMTPFMVAVSNKALNIMELLWNSGIVDNIDAQDNNGHTALFLACGTDDKAVVEFLLNKGFKNIADKNGMTPFMHAARNSTKDIVELIWNSGIVDNIEEQSKYGDTALHFACRRERTWDAIAMFLIEKGVKNTANKGGDSPFMRAAYNGMTDIMELMLEKQLIDNINAQDENGNTALHFACSGIVSKSVQIKTVKFLLDNGANNIANKEGKTPLLYVLFKEYIMELMLEKQFIDNIDAQDKHGNTALHWMASTKSHAISAKLLIKKGAKNIVSNDGETPWTYAVKKSTADVVELMLEKQFIDNIDVQDEHGNTALCLACMHNQTEVARFLLDKGAKNIANHSGDTPFMYAANKGMTEIVELMWNKGIVNNIDAQNKSGETALYSACSYTTDTEKTVRFLLDKGAKNVVAPSAKHGGTPLLVALRCYSYNIVKLMLTKWGADDNIDAQDKNGCTALYWAANNDIEVTRWLLKKGAKNVANNNGDTPFMRAVLGGNMKNTEDITEVIKCMLENGFVDNINTEDKFGFTPLSKACHYAVNGEIITLLIQSGADIGRRAADKYWYIQQLLDYQDGKKLADDSDNYKLAMLNKLYMLYTCGSALASTVQEIVQNNEYLQSVLARGCMSNEEVVAMFDGDMASFFVKCKENLKKDVYCKYMDMTVNDGFLPLNIRKSAITSMMDQRFFNEHIGTLWHYIDKNANEQKEKNELWQHVNKEFNMLKFCYEYCAMISGYRTEEDVTSYTQKIFNDYGQNSRYLIEQLLHMYPSLWKKCLEFYEDLRDFNSFYAYEFFFGISEMLNRQYESNKLKQEHKEECEKYEKIDNNFYVMIDEASNKKLLIDVANYCAIYQENVESAKNLITKWGSKIKINIDLISLAHENQNTFDDITNVESVELIAVSDICNDEGV